MITANSLSSSSAVDIDIGSNITLSCTSSGSPPDTFTWMKDGVPVTQSTSIATVTHTPTSAVFSSDYTISNFSLTDNGTYTCTVTNPIGSDDYTFIVNIRKFLYTQIFKKGYQSLIYNKETSTTFIYNQLDWN